MNFLGIGGRSHHFILIVVGFMNTLVVHSWLLVGSSFVRPFVTLHVVVGSREPDGEGRGGKECPFMMSVRPSVRPSAIISAEMTRKRASERASRVRLDSSRLTKLGVTITIDCTADTDGRTDRGVRVTSRRQRLTPSRRRRGS